MSSSLISRIAKLESNSENEFFQYRLTSDFSEKGRVKFDEKITSSEDHGYDKSTGYFTARSDGLYLFYMQLSNRSSKQLLAYINQKKLVSDGSHTERCRGYTNEQYHFAHCTAVENLSAGDKVYVWNHYADSVIQGDSNAAHLSYFLGVKLN